MVRFAHVNGFTSMALRQWPCVMLRVPSYVFLVNSMLCAPRRDDSLLNNACKDLKYLYYLSVVLRCSFGEVPMKFLWGSDEVPMRFQSKLRASRWLVNSQSNTKRLSLSHQINSIKQTWDKNSKNSKIYTTFPHKTYNIRILLIFYHLACW